MILYITRQTYWDLELLEMVQGKGVEVPLKHINYLTEYIDPRDRKSKCKIVLLSGDVLLTEESYDDILNKLVYLKWGR